MPDNGGKRLKEEYETIDLRELFLLVKKNILMILAVTIASAAVGFLISNADCKLEGRPDGANYDYQ